MISLEKPNISHKIAYENMRSEWEKYENISDTSPWVLFVGNNFEEFLEIVKNLENNPPADRVQATLFFVMKENKIVGAVDIRHEIESSEYLKNFGGHIGYGILPTERGKWFASEALKLALLEAKKLVTDNVKVLIVCLESNIASARVIEKNGGKFEKNITDNNGNLYRRYWIYL